MKTLFVLLLALTFTVTAQADEGYKSVTIPAGTFTMGSPETERGRRKDEKQVKVTITRAYFMMQSEVTQRFYTQIVGKNPSYFTNCTPACPVEMVSWFDAVKFANTLSRKERLESCYVIHDKQVSWAKGFDCKGWRLPTEAEWEWAARGGQTFVFAGSNKPREVAWYQGRRGMPAPVCQKKRNGYGLCDMSGNVSEWVWDKYKRYGNDALVDPRDPKTRPARLPSCRGGDWQDTPEGVRVASRSAGNPASPKAMRGFRLVRTVK